MAFPSLSIGDLTAKMPIVQGGMGVGISLSGLASAVANQGGIGVIAGAMIGMKEPDVAKNPIEANPAPGADQGPGKDPGHHRRQHHGGADHVQPDGAHGHRKPCRHHLFRCRSAPGDAQASPAGLRRKKGRVQDQAGPHRLFRPRGDPDRPQMALPLRLSARRLRGGRPQGRRPPRLQA